MIKSRLRQMKLRGRLIIFGLSLVFLMHLRCFPFFTEVPQGSPIKPINSSQCSSKDCSSDLDIRKIVFQRIYESALLNVSRQPYQGILDLLRPDGSFSDLPYGQHNSDPFISHGERQGALVYYHIKGERNLKSHIENCFQYITYHAPQNPDPNWWGDIIGTPTAMWPGAVLAKGIISEKLLKDFLDRYWVKTKAGPVWSSEDTGKTAGANFASRAHLAEIEGHLRGNYQEVHEKISKKMYKEIALRNPHQLEGLRPDGCLQQHTIKYEGRILWNPYDANYGMVFMKELSQIMAWYADTDLQFDDASVEGMYSSYFDCQQWVFRGHVVEPTLVGRKIVDGFTTTNLSVEGIITQTGKNLLVVGRHVNQVRAVMHRREHVPPDPEYALVGHRHFFNSDVSAHQRREFFASVRILSWRTMRPESWEDGMNSRGYYLADGFLTVIVDGEEYGSQHNEVFQVYDWARIPSVTIQYTTHIKGYGIFSGFAKHYINDAKFAGGVTNGVNGMASMVYNRPHVPLKALKSWFFFDNVILVVGSRITLDSHHVTDNLVATTLTQIIFEGTYTVCKRPGDEVNLQMGTFEYEDKPSWLFHRGVSYVFLNGDEHLYVKAETHTHDQNKSLDVFTAWTTHGKHPVDATLEYAVLPATTLEATREFAKQPTVQVITKDKNTHVVCHLEHRMVAASLSEGGSVEVSSCGEEGPLEIHVEHPCLLLADIEEAGDNGRQIHLSISDPQQIYDSIEVKFFFKGQWVNKKIQLPNDPKRGSSVTTTFQFSN